MPDVGSWRPGRRGVPRIAEADSAALGSSVLARSAAVAAVLGAWHFRGRSRQPVACSGYRRRGGDFFVVQEADDGRTKAPNYTGKAIVFWDLDNKMPPKGVGVRSTIEAVRSFLLEYTRAVEAVNIYANTSTLSCARGKLKADSSEALPTVDDYDETEAPAACPVCGRALKGNVWARRQKLQRHLDMHRQEFKKRQVMRACLGRNMRSSQKLSFGSKNAKYVEGRQAILDLLGGMDGVKLRALQKEAVRQIQGYDDTTMRPVPTRPQAADEEIVHDMKSMLHRCSGQGTICLISDDGGFVRSLLMARESGWRVVTISERETMLRISDVGVPWDEVTARASKIAKSDANAQPDVYFNNPYRKNDHPLL